MAYRIQLIQVDDSDGMRTVYESETAPNYDGDSLGDLIGRAVRAIQAARPLHEMARAISILAYSESDFCGERSLCSAAEFALESEHDHDKAIGKTA